MGLVYLIVDVDVMFNHWIVFSDLRKSGSAEGRETHRGIAWGHGIVKHFCDVISHANRALIYYSTWRLAAYVASV
jgi:hypothetical protein